MTATWYRCVCGREDDEWFALPECPRCVPVADADTRPPDDEFTAFEEGRLTLSDLLPDDGSGDE